LAVKKSLTTNTTAWYIPQADKQPFDAEGISIPFPQRGAGDLLEKK